MDTFNLLHPSTQLSTDPRIHLFDASPTSISLIDSEYVDIHPSSTITDDSTITFKVRSKSYILEKRKVIRVNLR